PVKKIWHFFKPFVKKNLFPFAGIVYSLICCTLMKSVQMKISGWEHQKKIEAAGKKYIYAIWDGRQMFLLPFAVGKNLVILATRSDVGEVLKVIHRFFTIKVVRGSSSSGGASALKGMIRAIRSGLNGALAVDGPQGPAQIAKPGIIQIAKMSGAVILPLSAGVKKKLIVDYYWNKVQIPAPFTSGRYVIGKPVEVPRNADRQEMNKMLALLQMELEKITKESDGFRTIL
ncbi:MAG: DUF374 domain-containing protein, partial [Elusimicrobiota bacterium]|nr:DUF374 domain-containing protein [Elusimicrobiota bacterium]